MKTPKSWYKFKIKDCKVRQKHHFVSEILDSGESVIVHKYWHANKKRWEYSATHKTILMMFHW